MIESSHKKNNLKPASLLIWDQEDDIPPENNRRTLLWRSFGERDSVNLISLPRFVEENANILKKKYLAWVYELAETKIGGQRLLDYLELRPGFSYWWMTLLAEKCNFAKSPQIDEAIKLMAFESWMAGKSIEHVILITSNAPLAECIDSWCAYRGITFEWQQKSAKKERSSLLRRVYGFLPHALQALIWLALYLVERWPLKEVGLQEWRQTVGRVTFISYLFNLVPEATDAGQFKSNYWASLPDALQREGCKTNWLHLFVKGTLLTSSDKAAVAIRQFNSKAKGSQVHVTLDTFLNWRVVLGAVRDWVRLRRVGQRIKFATRINPGVNIDPGPLLEKDWRRSFVGKEALSNLLSFNLFESAMRDLPVQRMGVYLQENQAWEFALINAWRSGGHKRIIGVPHSTMRFWDLRYFFDARSYMRGGKNELPLPDAMAINGGAMKESCTAAGYPSGDLVEVEALRYLHIGEPTGKGDLSLNFGNPLLRILVVGDYLPINTKRQMQLLEKAAGMLPENTIFIVKPHPACPIFAKDYPGLAMEVLDNPLVRLFNVADVVYSSNVTSAAVDAYCAGIPVVCVLDPNILNQSPLRGRHGVVFAATPEELANALISSRNAWPGADELPRDFFTLDPNLPRWKALLLTPSVQ